jgi:hypothetical protein
MAPSDERFGNSWFMRATEKSFRCHDVDERFGAHPEQSWRRASGSA